MQLYHDALLLPRFLGFVCDRRCNSIMTPYCFLDSWVRHLVILSDRNQPRDGLSLIVEKPWAGAFVDHWPRLGNNSVLPRLFVEVPLSEGKSAWVLQSSIHNEAPNPGRALTLGQRLIEGQTRWGTVTKVPREFCFTDCYWEWLELVVGRNTRLLYSTHLYGVVTASLYTYDRNSDVVRAFCEAWCPLTNTLHTMASELSISLWDLWSFGGLPIKGDFYEERIPSFKELTSTSRDKTKCLPTTCQYLFQAYYSIPTTQKEKKAPRSKSTQNLDGSKIQAREWSSRESMLFAELGIKNDLKDETYLAAFLSCWLCLFVFPQKGSFLRPGVFRAGSLMAAGTIYSLAVPVLKNIYHGLGLITKASNPIGRMNFHFPMHYVHGWLAYYFGTHYPLPTEVRGPKMTNFSGESGSIYFGEYEARELIHNGARIQWHANLQNRSKHERMVDTHDSSFLQMSYYPRLPKNRGSNLGGKEIRLVEAMAPNLKEEVKEHKDKSDSRKSDRHWKRPLKKAKVSGDHLDGRGMPPAITLDNILYHWRICTRRNTLSELYLPAHSLEPCKHVTQRFTDWWTTKHETYFEDNRHHLAMAPNLEEEVKEHKDESDSSKSDRHWKRPLKKAKVSGDHPDGRGLSALAVPDVPPLSPLNDHLEGLIEPDSDESLTGPHSVDSTFEEVGTSKTSINKSAEQSLRPSALLKEIRRGKMTMKGKVLETLHPKKKTALCMWKNIQDKIMQTPFEYIPRLRPEIATVLSGIEKIHADGPTSLEEYLNSYLKRVDNFNEVQSSYSTQLLSTDKARQLNEKTSAIKEALTLVKQLRGDAKVTEAIDQQELEVAKLQDEVNTLESTPAITEEVIEALVTVR
ncbi:hypothetical protein E5676_scaffold306G004010 [Cucumis melo var. makuwa]|uniref:Aminotransferase-like plant mobile domain-containing protein n=1 Tax=Cucumis melo var. makuwa TaxID=1194695 RepID=A0A5D3D2X6_CUCMM|nr:hypothetical protein E5676_scaffold306G004010 [Cucumis melo var. makuwa]